MSGYDGGGVRTRGGRGGRRGRGVRTRGGRGGTRGGRGAQRPDVSNDINIGMIEELPSGTPLETPLHPPRRRRLPATRPSGVWQPTTDAEGSGSVEGDVGQAGDQGGVHSTTPGFIDAGGDDAGGESNAFPPSPAVYVSTTSNPRSTRVPPRGRLNDVDIEGLLNYGSEEEEEEESQEVTEVVVPRVLRMFFETDVDTPEETEAAGRVEMVDVDVDEPHGPTTMFNFDWGSYPAHPIPPEERREQFVGNSGPTIDPTTNPYDIFIRIWDRSIMEHIVTQTNLYAQQLAAEMLNSGMMGPQSRIASWKDTTIDEMYVYFAIILAMGVVVKSKMEEYWCRDSNVFSTPQFSTQMTLKRFQILNRCLHFNDNTEITAELSINDAKVVKIAPIVDHLNEKFSALYDLHQNVALDESLTQWKGWLNIKQYIPNKKSAVGIKTYEVCDSRTGYLWRFQVHTGGEAQPDNAGIINGGIPNLVLQLLRGLEHTGRTIWMDNYYNSPSLARVLKTLGLDCVGTLRTNRQFVPNQIVALKKGDMRVGQVCGCTSGDVDLMVWRDQNRVAMISTYHGVAVSGSKPVIVKDYNVCMGGVDRKDQMLSTYPIERKRTQVWYKKFFKRLLNVSVLNAFIIAKHCDPKVDHRGFRKQLIIDLLSKHKSNPQPESQQPIAGPKLTREVLSHFPSKLPPLPSRGQQKRICAYCKIKRTSNYCQKCQAALCFSSGPEDCYLKYHS